MTNPEIWMWSHAFGVIYDRGEERRKRENTCERCGFVSVHDDDQGRRVCGHCNWAQRVNVPARAGKRAFETIEWPPNSGRIYVGDKDESAVMKLKKDCQRRGKMGAYFDYCQAANFGR